MRHDITENEKARSDIVGQRQERYRREIEGPEHKFTQPETKGHQQQIAEDEKGQRDITQRYETTEAHKNGREITARNIQATRHEKSIECQLFKISKFKRNRRKTEGQATQFSKAQKGWREIEDQRSDATETDNDEREIAASAQKLEVTGQNSTGGQRPNVSKSERNKRKTEGQRHEVTEAEKGWRQIECQSPSTKEADEHEREIVSLKHEITGYEKSKRDIKGQVHELEKARSDNACQRRRRNIRELASWRYFPKLTKCKKGRKHDKIKGKNRDQKHRITAQENTKRENVALEKKREEGKTFIY